MSEETDPTQNAGPGGRPPRSARWRWELGALFLLLLLPLALFWSVAVGSRTLLPADNLYQWQPYRAFAEQMGVRLPAQNELLSDLVLENLAWKRFVVESLQEGQVPLWNPHLFAGVPFLAAGQHSAMYPFSLLFYVLPLSRAYGIFTVLQLWLAGFFAYLFARTLRLRPLSALIAGVTYQLSAFFLVSVVFTMIIAAAAWLPLLLAIIETVVRKQEEKGSGPFVPILYVAAGAVTLGMVVLAGHPEVLVYTLLVMAVYALARLVLLRGRVRAWRPALRISAWLVLMVALGLGLGSVQLIPLLELVTKSFREGSVTYQDVVGWAYPPRQIATFLVPDFFGNPATHGYWDLVTRQWVPLERTFWGIKNYVEAGSYVGVLPLVLALLAVLGTGKTSPNRRHVWILAGLALVSLLLVFGTPLYALLYYGLPGIKQLHSPFRWVWPYTLSIAMLAAFGAEALAGRRSRLLSVMGWAAAAAGAAAVGVLLLARAAPAQVLSLVDRFMAAMPETHWVFGSQMAFLSYEWPELLAFGGLLLASGVVLLVAGRQRSVRRLPLAQLLAVAVVAGDLLLFGAGFNPASDPAWPEFRPPALEWLQQQAEAETPWRLTSYQVEGDTKTLNANIPWLAGLQDVRGYDSIIPRQYVDLMRCIEPQGELPYNRIAPIYDAAHLSSPLLDLLNVRYVVTEGTIANDDYALVYDGEVRIYENTDVLPRAFAFVATDGASPAVSAGEELCALDPRTMLLLDASEGADGSGAVAAVRGGLRAATIESYSANEVTVDVEMPEQGWLVLADSYFPGWKAYRSVPPPVAAEIGDASEEVELQIVRADGNFRAVRLEAGSHRVRFKYTPMSVKLGLYGSFMACVVLLLLVLFWLWGRLYRERADDPTAKRVAKNSLLPMGLQLLNRVIDLAFAMLMLRILAPEMAGRFTFAIGLIGYFDILVRFGLGTLLTREVARDRTHGNRYLSTVGILRGFLWLGSLPLMGLAVGVYALLGQMSGDIALAIGLFAVGLIFSALADGFSSVLNAYEKMEYPAAVATLTAVTRVSLGALVLLAGWGFVGLAGVSIVANIVSAVLLGVLMARHCFRPTLEGNRKLGRWMMGASFPLMLNLFLATAFFRIDVLLLKPLRGDAAVGYYGAAYKFIDGLNIFPSFFTMAVFPLMSRYAVSARDSLMRAYVLSLRLLLMIAIPITVGTFFVAEGFILLLGGAQYLPDSRVALQLLIWFLPFSFINSVTQYVLIAIDEQKFLTRAFVIGVAFNLTANLIAIPLLGYRGAAIVTVLSELALLAPFYYSVRRHLGPLPWGSLFWRPVVASLVMGGAMWLLRGLWWPLLIPIGAGVYGMVLTLLGGLRQPDMDVIWKLLPLDRLRARWARR